MENERKTPLQKIVKEGGRTHTVSTSTGKKPERQCYKTDRKKRAFEIQQEGKTTRLGTKQCC